MLFRSLTKPADPISAVVYRSTSVKRIWGQDLTSLGEMGLGSLPLLTVAKGDTAILLSAMSMLKYCEALSGELRDLPAGAGNNKQKEMYETKIFKR